MSEKVTVAIIQARPAYYDLEASVEKAVALIQEAATQGAGRRRPVVARSRQHCPEIIAICSCWGPTTRTRWRAIWLTMPEADIFFLTSITNRYTINDIFLNARFRGTSVFAVAYRSRNPFWAADHTVPHH